MVSENRELVDVVTGHTFNNIYSIGSSSLLLIVSSSTNFIARINCSKNGIRDSLLIGRKFEWMCRQIVNKRLLWIFQLIYFEAGEHVSVLLTMCCRHLKAHNANFVSYSINCNLFVCSGYILFHRMHYVREWIYKLRTWACSLTARLLWISFSLTLSSVRVIH